MSNPLRWLLSSTLLIPTLVACAPDGASEDPADDAFFGDGKADGLSATPGEILAILSVCNSATLAELRDEVGLSARASTSIVEARAGEDGEHGTADDETLDSLIELDALPYVGPIAFGKLRDHVHAIELVQDAGKRVFITSSTYDGAFTRYTGLADGVAAADHLCQLHADDASLGGRFVAWVSSSSTAAIHRVEGPGPWYRLDGRVAVRSRAQLELGPELPIKVTNQGGEVALTDVWSGTLRGGRASYSCGSWTTNHFDSMGAIYGWADDTYSRCDERHRLLCFEQ